MAEDCSPAAAAAYGSAALAGAMQKMISAVDKATEDCEGDASSEFREAEYLLRRAIAELRSAALSGLFLAPRSASMTRCDITGIGDFSRRFESLSISKEHRSAVGSVDGKSVILHYEIMY